MKVAIYGGSFNPVHNEHINIVKSAAAELKLDKVIVMPSNVTPLKSGKMTADGKDRLNMCRMAFDGVDKAYVSSFELENGGVSYTYLTCREFAKRYPNDERYFILGADMLENFERWKNPEEILNCVTLAVCAREDGKKLDGIIENFEKKFNRTAVRFGYTGAKVSSTRVRTLAALGEDISAFTPPFVAGYAAANALYRIEYAAEVRAMLKPERWAHTVRVCIMAAENCARCRVDEKTAVTAAVLHDCAKYLTQDSPLLEGFSAPQDVPPAVLHQYSGAYVAERLFGIHDSDILNAVRFHSSGRENMSPLEKLIYLSDLLEEGRNFDGVEKLREEFYRDIDAGLLCALSHQIAYLESSGQKIYPLTLRAYEYMKNYLKKDTV